MTNACTPAIKVTIANDDQPLQARIFRVEIDLYDLVFYVHAVDRDCDLMTVSSSGSPHPDGQRIMDAEEWNLEYGEVCSIRHIIALCQKAAREGRRS